MKAVNKLFGFLTLGLLLVMSLTSQAQKDLLQQLEGKTKMSEITFIVNSYFSSKRDKNGGHLTKEEEKSLMHWKRLEYFMSSRLDEKGDVVNYSERIYKAIQEQNEINTNQTNSSYGSWGPIGPTSSGKGIGRVSRIAFHPTDPNIIYIGAARGGLWKTTNGGVSWTNVNSFISGLGISGIVIDEIDPNIIYILTGEGDAQTGGLTQNYGYISWSIGVLKSTDGGITWNKTAQFPGLQDFYTGYKLVQDPNNANVLFAATSIGLYKTESAGRSWSEVYDKRTYDVAFKPGSSTSVYATIDDPSKPFILSTATGDTGTWNKITLPVLVTNLGRCAIGVSPINPSVVYLVTSNRFDETYEGLFKSTNSGVSFSKIHSSPDILVNQPGISPTGQAYYDLGIAVSTTNINTVTVGGIDSWLSTNGGVSFAKNTVHGSSTLPSPLSNYVHADCHELAFNPLSNILYDVNDGGVWSSSDNGVSWIERNTGLQITQFYHGAGADAFPNMILGGVQDNGTKLRPAAGGNTYTHIMSADGFAAAIDYNTPSTGYGVANRVVHKLTGLGTTNQSDSILAGDTFFPNIAINSGNPQIIYVGYYHDCLNCNYLSKSVDGGANWTNLLGATADWAIATCASNANRLYTAGRVYKSDGQGGFAPEARITRVDNGGSLVTDLTTNPGMIGVDTLNICRITSIGTEDANSNHVWITLGGWIDGTKVFYSDDGGLNWKNRSGSLPNVPVNCVTIDNSGGAYLGTDIGVFYRGVSASDWTPFYNGLPQVPVTDIILNTTAGTVKAVTHGRGVWQSALYSPCIPSLNLSGDISGNQFFEAASDISSTNVTTGGVETKIGLKAGNYVLLNIGFIASTQQEFRAYIGGCGNGGVPFNILTDSSSQMEITSIAPPANGMKFPYGNLTTIENLGQTLNVSIRTAREGNQQLLFTDSKGTIIRKQNDLNISIGERTLEMEIGKNTPGTYYLFLYQDNILIHFQEVIVK